MIQISKNFNPQQKPKQSVYHYTGLEKLWNPAVSDGKTWSKFGEPGEKLEKSSG